MRDINFFSEYKGKDKEKKNEIIYIYGAIGIVGILIVSTLLFNTGRILLLNNTISNYNKKLEDPTIKEKYEYAENIIDEITLLSQYDSALSEVLDEVNSRDNVSDIVLNSINSTIPTELSFKSLQINNDVLTIQGVSSTRDAVGEFQHNLKELSIISEVFVNSIDINNSVEGQYSFDIKCVLKEVN